VFVVVAPTAVVLFVATAFAGLGQSLYPIARITILSSIYPDRIGSALGVTMAMGDLGQTVIPPVAGMVAVTISWEFGMVFLIPILVLVAFMLWIALPQTEPTESAVDTLSVESFRYVFGELRRSNLVFVALILFLYILVWQSFTGFYPTYLAEVKRMSSSTAGLIFSVFFAFGVVVKPLAGAAYDRIGMRNALILVLIGPMVGFAALPFITGFWPLVGVTAIVSTMLGSGAITQSYLSDSLSEDIEGTGLGVVRTAVSSLGASGPVLFGMVADRGYFDEGYVLLALVTGLVIILTYRLPTPESS
jgi:MFS family permease